LSDDAAAMTRRDSAFVREAGGRWPALVTFAAVVNHSTKDQPGGWCELVAAGVFHELDTLDDLTA
jgi:hypothetical protein